MNPQKSWPQHTLIQKRNRGRHTGGALLSCKKGRPDRNLRDLRADEDEQTGGSGLSETVDRPGLRKIEEKNICVCLTELGRIRGEECRHRHETFTQLLEYVGVESRIAEEDACRMEHVVSDETVQQICNFVNYGSTFEHALRNTDLRYRYEPGEYSFLMGIYYMEKTCPRRLAGEFKNYKEQIRLHVKKEDSYFELFCTAPEEKNCSLVCGPRNRLGKSRRRKRKSPDPNRRF